MDSINLSNVEWLIANTNYSNDSGVGVASTGDLETSEGVTAQGLFHMEFGKAVHKVIEDNYRVYYPNARIEKAIDKTWPFTLRPDIVNEELTNDARISRQGCSI